MHLELAENPRDFLFALSPSVLETYPTLRLVAGQNV